MFVFIFYLLVLHHTCSQSGCLLQGFLFLFSQYPLIQSFSSWFCFQVALVPIACFCSPFLYPFHKCSFTTPLLHLVGVWSFTPQTVWAIGTLSSGYGHSIATRKILTWIAWRSWTLATCKNISLWTSFSLGLESEMWVLCSDESEQPMGKTP